jgi:hypothetical protein
MHCHCRNLIGDSEEIERNWAKIGKNGQNLKEGCRMSIASSRYPESHEVNGVKRGQRKIK